MGLLCQVAPLSHDTASVVFASVRPVPNTFCPRAGATSLSPPPMIVGPPKFPVTLCHVLPLSSEYQNRSPLSGPPGKERVSGPIPVGAAIQIRWCGSVRSTRIDGSAAWYRGAWVTCTGLAKDRLVTRG